MDVHGLLQGCCKFYISPYKFVNRSRPLEVRVCPDCLKYKIQNCLISTTLSESYATMFVYDIVLLAVTSVPLLARTIETKQCKQSGVLTNCHLAMHVLKGDYYCLVVHLIQLSVHITANCYTWR
jgi:hypothetical protein